MNLTTARIAHGTVVVAGALGLGAQVIALVGGERYSEMGPGMAWSNFFSYFTILSNVLVFAVNLSLVVRPGGFGTEAWRVARLNALVNIAVTGLIAFTILRHLPEVRAFSGAARFADVMLHYVVPVLTIAVWVIVGPRPRLSLRTAWLSLMFPAAYIVYTMIRGAWVGWYPYPFIDLRLIDPLEVLVNSLLIGAMFLGFAFIALRLDERLAPRPSAPEEDGARV